MAAVRLAPLALLAALLLAGCGEAGGGKIEPEAKGASGSPILNREKGAQAATPPPANQTNP